METHEHTSIRLNLAKALCHRLVSAYPKTIQAFIVYGSVAIGSAKKTSDIDIQIISDNPSVLLQSKTELILREIQQKSGVKIVVNVKTPSFVIEELVQGDSFHVLMFLNGICLLESSMFKNLKSLVHTKKLPKRAVIEDKVRKEVQNWSEELFTQRLINFNSDCSLSVFQFLAFKKVLENEYRTWEEQEISIQRSSKHMPTINELLPNYSNCLDNFLSYNKNINTISQTLNAEHGFNLIELLKCMRHILKKTSELK